MAVRVYLADEDAEVRRAVGLMLEHSLGVKIAGEAAHTYGLPSLVDSAGSDIVLIDWDLRDRVDAWLIAELHRLSRRPAVIATSCRADVKEAAMAAGAEAFVDKSEPPEALLRVVRACLERTAG